MPEFKRYRDEHGHEFSSAVSPELAAAKGWKDITSDVSAVMSDGAPRAAKPAPRKQVAAAKKVSSAPASRQGSTSTEGA